MFLLDEALRKRVSDESKPNNTLQLTSKNLPLFFSLHDIKRLESYGNNLVDYHMIVYN